MVEERVVAGFYMKKYYDLIWRTTDIVLIDDSGEDEPIELSFQGILTDEEIMDKLEKDWKKVVGVHGKLQVTSNSL